MDIETSDTFASQENIVSWHAFDILGGYLPPSEYAFSTTCIAALRDNGAMARQLK